MASTFESLGLKEEILKALNEINFVSPTPIQAQAIPHIIEESSDLVALAQTGTGKTAAFSLPILHRLDASDKTTQALVLSPTRELCLQIARDIEVFSKYQKGINSVAVYGGSNIVAQIRQLEKGAQIVIGTPGRTLDLVKRKKLKLQDINFLVLDEADEMLSMGFQEDLDAILSMANEDRQSVLFSATMPKEIRRLAKKYMDTAEEISVMSENKSTENVSHHYYATYEKNRYATLKRLADLNTNIYSIIFCRTRIETQRVADKLMQDGYSADCIHGELSQAQRDIVMKKFRDKKIQMLVATDVAARGIDVNDLTHVINYNLPDSLETYVHRSGRTGRAGNKGICITIINARENRRIKQVEHKIGRKFELKQIPSGQEICKVRIKKLMTDVMNVEVNEDEMSQFSDEIATQFQDVDRDELIRRFLSVEFNRFLEYYKNAGDLNVAIGKGRDRDRGGRDSGGDRRGRDRDRGRGRDRNRHGNSEDFTRYFINVGKANNLSPKDLIMIINKNLKSHNFKIGDIDIQKSFSFFEVEKGLESEVIANISKAQFRRTSLNVEIANPKGSRPKKRGTYKKKKKKHRKGNRGKD